MCEGCHAVATQAKLLTLCCSPAYLGYPLQNATVLQDVLAPAVGPSEAFHLQQAVLPPSVVHAALLPCCRHIGCNEATCKLCRHNRARVCQLDFRAQQFLAGVSTEKGLKTPCEGGSELALHAVGASSQDVQKDWPDVISDLQLEVSVV